MGVERLGMDRVVHILRLGLLLLPLSLFLTGLFPGALVYRLKLLWFRANACMSF